MHRVFKISVIITCYNYGHFLAEAIESALNQTIKDLEIIVVNDGSADNTTEIARCYPVVLIDQDNQGLPTARNIGISKSKGIYVLPLDADDKLRAQYLEKTVPILDRHSDVAVVYTHRRHFGDLDTIKKSEDFDLEKLKQKCFINYCALIRKQVWKECGGYNPNMKWGYEDWDLWLSIAERGWEFKLMAEPLLFYRKHGHSLRDLAQDHHDELLEQLRKNHPRLFANAFV